MLASRLTGAGVMPAGLGLHLGDFLDLVDRHFPGVWIPAAELPVPGGFDREEERQELYRLLLTYRANEDHSERWIARMVAAGCMGADHLWQDMGLWSRRDLSALLQGSFPELAARNDRDMKWKKFLYRQLCQEEGIYTCRSPSCEVCVDYASCFTPEV